MDNKLKDMYSIYLANLISRGNIASNKLLNSFSLKSSFDKIMTKKSIKKVWAIQSIGINNSIILTQFIRSEMKKQLPKCKTTINMHITPYKIETDKDKFINGMLYSDKNFRRYSAELENMSNIEKIVGKKIKDDNNVSILVDEKLVDSYRTRKESFEYISKHSYTDGNFALVYIFIEASSNNSKLLKNYGNILRRITRSINVIVNELYGNMSGYLNNFSPTVVKDPKEFISHVNAILMSDENITSILPYPQSGVIGTEGVCHGMIIDSHVPLNTNYTEGTTAQVIAVVAKSGHGKTFYVINASNYHIGLDHYISIMDYKGNEYSALTTQADAIEVDFKDNGGWFVNTLKLDFDDSYTYDEKLDLYSFCIQETVGILCEMVGKVSNADKEDIRKICHDSVLNLYNEKTVIKEDVSTYKKTEGIHIKDVLKHILDLQNSIMYSEEQKTLIATIYNRCSNFLSESGMYYGMFKNEISIREAFDAKVIIYNFGKNSEPKDSSFDIKDKLRIRQMNFLDTKKLTYAKKRNKFLVAIYEELQRSVDDPEIISVVSQKVTGGRSDGIIIYLVFNSSNIFKVADKNMQSIASNITTWVIGYLEKPDIESLSEIADLEEVIPLVELIRDNQKKLHRCFVVKYDTGVHRDIAIVRVDLPEHIAEGELFSSRRTENV